MIKIVAFYPFQNLLRVTQEFYEDKALVKIKSLALEREFDIAYEDVAEISDSFGANNSQNNFGFWLLPPSALILGLFDLVISVHPVLLHSAQLLYICGLFLYITGFIKSWRIFIADKNGIVLTTLKQTNKNRDVIPEIIEMIRTRSKDIQELSVTSPFPKKPALFEHIEFNISNLVKTTDRFYEAEIIGYQKSVFEENVYKIGYDQLSGKVFRGKVGLEIWGWSLTIVTLLTSTIAGFYFGFGVSLGRDLLIIILDLMLTLIALFLISLPLNLIKRDAIGLYSKNGNIAYFTYATGKNKDNIEKIIRFIQARITTEKNNGILED